MSRQPISKTARFEVFKRDQFTCQYCGAHPPQAILELDHINPVANGGDNDEDNLVTACQPCNRGKGARLLTAVPRSLAQKAADALEREEQLQGYNDVLRQVRERLEDQSWEVADTLIRRASETGMNKQKFHTIRHFVEKLGFEVAMEAATIAEGKCVYSEYQRFKYFCGICWKKIKES